MTQPNSPSIRGHLMIMRMDHWVKNVFVVPGIIIALSFDRQPITSALVANVILGLVAICIVASSYYTLNEVLDAPYDRGHPIKFKRPVPSGMVHIPLAYAQWIALGVAGIAMGLAVNRSLGITLGVLWLMGCAYNIPPVRTKDVPYLDVVSEAANNPLRLLVGWFMVNPVSVAPASLLMSYWFVGAYFMAIKRFAEFREIGDSAKAAAYRRSFAFYSEQRLLTSILFYCSAAMLFLGAFTMRYRLELLLAYPLVALVMAIYFDLAFQEDSPAQAPETLHRVPSLMISVVLCAVTIAVLCFVDLPWLQKLFAPTIPGAVPQIPGV